MRGSHFDTSFVLRLQELFEQAGAQLGSELEEIVPCLLRKAGEMSTAGRDNFLAQYADAALSQMVLSCPEAQCARALLNTCATVQVDAASCMHDKLCSSAHANFA